MRGCDVFVPILLSFSVRVHGFLSASVDFQVRGVQLMADIYIYINVYIYVCVCMYVYKFLGCLIISFPCQSLSSPCLG